MEQPVAPKRPNTHLTFAILTTIFCFWPLGIVAIVKASKVNSLYNQERYEEANIASRSAKKWCFATLISGIVVLIVAYVYTIIMAANMYY